MSRVTLRDVALKAGVSTAATSQALNDRGNLRPETRERIKAIAVELGYSPNRHAAALRKGRTMSIGFVMAATSLQDGRRALQRARQLDALVGAGAVRGFTVTVLPDTRPDLLAGAQIDGRVRARGRRRPRRLEELAVRVAERGGPGEGALRIDEGDRAAAGEIVDEGHEVVHEHRDEGFHALGRDALRHLLEQLTQPRIAVAQLGGALAHFRGEQELAARDERHLGHLTGQ